MSLIMKYVFYLLATVSNRQDVIPAGIPHTILINWIGTRVLHAVLEEWTLSLLGKTACS